MSHAATERQEASRWWMREIGVEDVLRCRRVCRYWRDLLEDPGVLASLVECGDPRLPGREEESESQRWVREAVILASSSNDCSRRSVAVTLVRTLQGVLCHFDLLSCRSSFVNEDGTTVFPDLSSATSIHPRRRMLVAEARPPVRLSDGRVDEAVSFPGDVKYLRVGRGGDEDPESDASLDIRPGITVEAVVMPMGEMPDPAWQWTIFSNHGVASGWEIRGGTGSQEFIVSANNRHYEARCEARLETGKWYHLMGHLWPDGRVAVSVDGVVGQTQPTVPWSEGGGFNWRQWIGDLEIGRNPQWNNRSYVGRVARVRVMSYLPPPSLYLQKP